MKSQFIEIPASKKSISSRGVIHGVGINDADYMVRITRDQKTHQCPLYRTWLHMLERCYSKKFKEKHDNYDYINNRITDLQNAIKLYDEVGI